MYATMLNLIVFLNFALIFIKSGNKDHFISWILLSVPAILFVVQTARFWRYPDSYGYFRYSFRETELAMKHYMIIITFLITVVVLIALMQSLLWTPAIPALLLLIYILAYKPYKELSENLRAAFNLVTICAFVGFRFWVSQCEKKTLYSQTFTTIVLVVFLLAMASAAVGIVFACYYYYLYNFKLVEEQKMEKVKDDSD